VAEEEYEREKMKPKRQRREKLQGTLDVTPNSTGM